MFSRVLVCACIVTTIAVPSGARESVFQLFHDLVDQRNLAVYETNEANSGTIGSRYGGLRARHNGLDAFGSEESAASHILISLPGAGELIFKKKYFRTSGERLNSIHRIWSGVPAIDEEESNNLIASLTHRANFVLMPNGELTCHVRVSDRQFECKPCSIHKAVGEEEKTCVDIVETERQKFPAEHSRPLPDHISRSIRQKFNGNRTLSSIDEQIELFENEDLSLYHLEDRVKGVEGRFLAEKPDDGSVIDVMILYTDAVVKNAGSKAIVEAEIANAIAETNDIFELNEVNTVVQLVAVGSVTFDENGDVETSLDYLTFDKTVANLRNIYGADLVSLITNDGQIQIDEGSTNLSCGVGWTSNPAMRETAPYAFSVVDYMCMRLNLSLQHEWGHNFGCDHDFENSNKEQTIPYAYGYVSETCLWHTIMGYPCKDSGRLAAYSTPYLQVRGKPLGEKDSAFCGRVLDDYRVKVAQYKSTVTDNNIPTPPETLAPTAAPTSAPTSSTTLVLTP